MSITVLAIGHTRSRALPLKLGGETTVVLDPKGAIVGQVVDEATGQPIGAFNLKRCLPSPYRKGERPPGSFLWALRQRGMACRPKDGKFVISDLDHGATYALVACAEGYAPAIAYPVVAQVLDWEGWPVVIKVNRGVTVSGRVLDAEPRRPVAGAEVFLIEGQEPFLRPFRLKELEDTDTLGCWVRRATTDSEGEFAFPGVTQGTRPSLVVRAPGRAISLANSLRPGEPATVLLRREATIAGTAKGYPGLKLETAHADVCGPDIDFGRVPLNKDWAFELAHVPSGDYKVALGDPSSGRRQVLLRVGAEETVRIDFAHLPGFKLYGRILRSGAAVGGADVQVNRDPEGQWVTSATTDAEGRYQMEGIPPGGYTLRVFKGEWKTPNRLHRIGYATVVARDVETNFVFHSGSIKGRILDSVGTPIGGAWVRGAQRLGPDAPPSAYLIMAFKGYDGEVHLSSGTMLWHSPRLLGLRATRPLGPTQYEPVDCGDITTGSDGSFSVENLAPGTYDLTVFRRGNAVPLFIRDIRIRRDGETQPVEARLDDRRALRLRTVDAETQRPIAGARVALCTPEGLYLAGYRPVAPGDTGTEKATGFSSDATGLVAVDGLLPADYGVWVVAEGYGARWVAPVAPARDKAAAPTAIALEPAGRLVLQPDAGLLKGLSWPYVVFRIRDAQGRAVFPGGECLIEQPLETGAGRLFGADPPGCRISVLPPGRYAIEWEIHSLPADTGAGLAVAPPATVRGKADFELRKGAETVLRLSR